MHSHYTWPLWNTHRWKGDNRFTGAYKGRERLPRESTVPNGLDLLGSSGGLLPRCVALRWAANDQEVQLYRQTRPPPAKPEAQLGTCRSWGVRGTRRLPPTTVTPPRPQTPGVSSALYSSHFHIIIRACVCVCARVSLCVWTCLCVCMCVPGGVRVCAWACMHSAFPVPEKAGSEWQLSISLLHSRANKTKTLVIPYLCWDLCTFQGLQPQSCWAWIKVISALPSAHSVPVTLITVLCTVPPG